MEHDGACGCGRVRETDGAMYVRAGGRGARGRDNELILSVKGKGEVNERCVGVAE